MSRAIVVCFLIASLILNVIYVDFLLPVPSHPDELVPWALAIAKMGPLDERTLFTHGHFHKYVLLAAMSPYYAYLKFSGKPLPTSFETASEEFIKIIYVLSRLVSVILGTATFFVIYLILNMLFARKILNIFLASLIGLSMVVVNLSHFAAYSIDSFFFATLLIYFLVYYSKYNVNKPRINYRWHTIIIGVLFGILVAGQYMTAQYFYLIMVFTLSFKSKIDFWQSIKRLCMIGIISAVIFVIINPFVLSPSFFKETFTFLIMHNTGAPGVGNLVGNDKHTLLTMIFRYIQSFGLLNSIMILIGAIAAFVIPQKSFKYIFGSWIVLYAFVMNLFAFFPVRWMLHFFVALIILFAITIHHFYEKKSTRMFTAIVLSVMILVTVLNSMQIVLLMKNDSRAIAKQELEPLLKPTDKLLFMYSDKYNPPLSQKKYNITILSVNQMNRSELDAAIGYINPDYIFSSSFYEERFLTGGSDYPKFGVFLRMNSRLFPFFSHNPDARDFFRDLHNNKTRFKLFRKYERNYMFPDPDFIDPDLYVYKKES